MKFGETEGVCWLANGSSVGIRIHSGIMMSKMHDEVDVDEKHVVDTDSNDVNDGFTVVGKGDDHNKVKERQVKRVKDERRDGASKNDNRGIPLRTHKQPNSSVNKITMRNPYFIGGH